MLPAKVSLQSDGAKLAAVVERRSLTPARSAKSRQPGLGFGDASSRPRHPRARWPHTDEEPRRIILDPSAASDRPVPRPRPPAPDLYRHTRGVHNKCPTVAGATVPRRKTRGRPIASPAALCVAGAVLACHCLRTVDWFGQGLQRVSAAAGESRALEAPCLERDEAMTSMRPSAAAVRFFFPSTTAAGE